MTQNNKLLLMYGGGAVLVIGVAYWIYQTKKNQLPLIDNARVYNNDETPTPDAPKSTKPNPFTSLVKNPLPSSIDFKPTDLNQLFQNTKA